MATASEPPQPDGPTPSDATPRAGEPLLFGRYRVERELGRGGMGRVVLAFDTKLRIHVAVKLVPDQVMADASAAEDLRTEVLRGIALAHPGIVRTHTFEQDSTGAAIVMEYIDGLSFAEWKEQQPGRCFNAEELLPWLEHLCAALDYAHHDARIVHRDLKPRNIMISHEGRLKVADFGISATISETSSRLTGTGQGPTSGTPAYMSPQQFQGKKPNPLDDVYGLGATIFDLLTSKPPFFRGTLHAIFHQLLTEQPASITERREELGITGKAPIPEVWEDTIAACLAKEPSARPQSCGEILARLRGSALMSRSAPSKTVEEAVRSSPEQIKSDRFESPTIPAPSKTLARNAEESAPGSGDLQSPTAPAAPEASISRGKSGGLSPAPVGRRLQTAAPSPTAPLPRRNPKWLITTAAAIFVLGFVMLWLLSGKKHEPVTQSSTAINATPAPPPSQAEVTPITATKDAPFVNSLGQEFVPVPGTPVLFCRTDVRVRDWQQFIQEKGDTEQSGIYALDSKEVKWVFHQDLSWKNPGFSQTGEHPVVGVSWEDAHRFCAWLSQKEGRTYRLPMDAEWSAAVGPETYPWGKEWPPPKNAGNYCGSESRLKSDASGTPGWSVIDGYNDGFARTSPVGNFPANRHGLYDMGGNVWQWCEDEYRSSMNEPDALKMIPVLKKEKADDGTPFRVLRGGAWGDDGRIYLRSSYRGNDHPGYRSGNCGFRVVLVLSGR